MLPSRPFIRLPWFGLSVVRDPLSYARTEKSVGPWERLAASSQTFMVFLGWAHDASVSADRSMECRVVQI